MRQRVNEIAGGEPKKESRISEREGERGKGREEGDREIEKRGKGIINNENDYNGYNVKCQVRLKIAMLLCRTLK